MALPPKHQSTRHVSSGGIEVCIDDDAMQGRGTYELADALYFLTQFGRLARLQGMAFRRHEADPQGACDDCAWRWPGRG